MTKTLSEVEAVEGETPMSSRNAFAILVVEEEGWEKLIL
jgi:hypothetical protein